MARVRVLGFSPHSVDRREQDISAVTVGELLADLGRRYPALRPVLEHQREDGRPYIKVMVNGRLAEQLQGWDTPLGPDDTVGVFPPVAGG
ncbi:MAG: MoaD/ThiS family protein [Chloroflexi bacterium]|nr:MoaD/ThiS family protein [Chloroflexota bacterium]MBU1748817.1 MoaD/ThiS family protein [Chloroflexota bacterium]